MPPRPFQLFPFQSLDGARQMAIDEWLLDRALQQRAAGGSGGFLRFYRWRRPTLSLGFHQRRLEPHWAELVAEGRIELVRRPSGGKAVLHAGDLTYALIWTTPPRSRTEAYRQACHWLCEAFRRLDLPLAFGSDPHAATGSNCFAGSGPADLVHRGGGKRIGSAQLWRRGCLLQHGSILLDPPVDLWRAVFDAPPPLLPALPVGGEELLECLRCSAADHLPQADGIPLSAAPEPLPQEWEAIAARLQRYRVALPSTSPEETIERAT